MLYMHSYIDTMAYKHRVLTADNKEEESMMGEGASLPVTLLSPPPSWLSLFQISRIRV